MKRKRRGRNRIVMLLLAVVLVGLFVQSEWLGRLIYPIRYADEIKTYAERNRLDPLLIAAIIKVESNYEERAVSRKGAIGLMQIMPGTAEELLIKEKLDAYSLDDVRARAEIGIRLGSRYMRDLLQQFDGRLAVSVAAYNAGPSRVSQWLADGVWDGDSATIRDIPYGETRQYVQRVMYYYKKYQEVYEHL